MDIGRTEGVVCSSAGHIASMHRRRLWLTAGVWVASFCDQRLGSEIAIGDRAPLTVSARHAAQWWRVDGGIHSLTQLSLAVVGGLRWRPASTRIECAPPAFFPATTNPATVARIPDTWNTLAELYADAVNVRWRVFFWSDRAPQMS